MIFLMNRRAFIAAVCDAAAWPFVAGAQAPDYPARQITLIALGLRIAL
jgi:hypothetical protein